MNEYNIQIAAAELCRAMLALKRIEVEMDALVGDYDNIDEGIVDHDTGDAAICLVERFVTAQNDMSEAAGRYARVRSS